MLSALKDALRDLPHAMQLLRPLMSTGVGWRALKNNFASSSDGDTMNLLDKFQESGMHRGEDPMVFLVRVDKFPSQMESANCPTPPGMMESHFLRSLHGDYASVVAVIRVGTSSRPEVEKAVQGQYTTLRQRKGSGSGGPFASRALAKPGANSLEGGCHGDGGGASGISRSRQRRR